MAGLWCGFARDSYTFVKQDATEVDIKQASLAALQLVDHFNYQTTDADYLDSISLLNQRRKNK